jgi:dynein heavy chain, axonemal
MSLSLECQVKKIVESRTLHMSVSSIPVAVAGTNAAYFLKLRPEPIPACASAIEAQAIMPSHVEWEFLTRHALLLLERVISQVYIPLLAAPADASSPDASSRGEPAPESSMSEEFLVALRKFDNHLRRTIQQVEGDVKLRMPNVPAATIANIDKCLADADAVKQVCVCVCVCVCVHACVCLSLKLTLFLQLESVLESWSQTIASVVEQMQRKVPAGPGPLAEIECWIERSSTLTALSEQLDLPIVADSLAVLTRAKVLARSFVLLCCRHTHTHTHTLTHSHILTHTRAHTLTHTHSHSLTHSQVAGLSAFTYHRAELATSHLEAKDNVKFLSTLERHFKSISLCPTFAQATELLPSLLNAVRMVWIISRHYNTDQRVVPLMERIAWMLVDKVNRRVNIRTIFRCACFVCVCVCVCA